jgi:nuclear transport factor 2 (NTF2) superfamily protein
MIDEKYLLSPFTEETAKQQIQREEDAWNAKNPETIALAYSVDSEWRNRDLFISGRQEIIAFLKGKWEQELDYKLKKSYWAHAGNRIAVRFEYEWRNPSGQWYRAYGNENWEFDYNGLMKKRFASINDLQIDASERRL